MTIKDDAKAIQIALHRLERDTAVLHGLLTKALAAHGPAVGLNVSDYALNSAGGEKPKEK